MFYRIAYLILLASLIISFTGCAKRVLVSSQHQIKEDDKVFVQTKDGHKYQLTHVKISDTHLRGKYIQDLRNQNENQTEIVLLLSNIKTTTLKRKTAFGVEKLFPVVLCCGLLLLLL